MDIDPTVIYFTFSRIRPRFSCGRTIESTLQQFRDGTLHPRDLPLLSVLTDGTYFFSQNNRRLYTYKQLKQEGLLEVVPVRLRPFPQTKRMQSKYTAETCSLTATLMRDVEKGESCGAAAASTRDLKGAVAQCEEEGAEDVDKDEREHEKSEERATHERGKDPVQTQASTSGTPSPQTKKARQKSKKKQQRGAVTGRRGGSESDDDDGDGESGGVNSLEAELRKLGLQ